MISLFLMYKYAGVFAKTTIAWLRLCRPGSVVGKEQEFLEEMESRIHKLIDSDCVIPIFPPKIKEENL
jgi:cell division cycle 14